ncbi:hypothetical protein Snoj_83290 [Streptomyces nojiriensis]|uniref:Xaa-Pro dipeptidyl-peptidase-like domain-containing protein n=1 Tax=Streptomyces nojiriensis TaxID=66374 RepID=A0ABQ3T214_9ACTN|nr:CocE/NonD family hydrolase [Streptomyces nojiriensis]GHI74411.1 hypothetical protein Snoj_83290 [Streptomyces nojiriensis]
MTGADGDLLDAALWRHTGTQPRPAIVMPSPWSNLGWLPYAVQASLFAARGYNVLAYSTRGFAGSEGQVDVAGPLDVADGSRALATSSNAAPARCRRSASSGTRTAQVSASSSPRTTPA